MLEKLQDVTYHFAEIWVSREGEMSGLENKVVIVAGAALGIGAATARKLAKDGAKVVVADLNERDAKLTADSIVAAGGTAKSFAFDITDEASIKHMIAFAVDHFGGLDGLHNNVADVPLCEFDTDLLTVDLAVWNRTLEVNLTGFLRTMRQAIPQMLKRGGGSIVNTSSAAAFAGEPTRPAYGTSKAGVVALTRHVAAAYGKQGIRCNSVAPGAIATENASAVARKVLGDPSVWFDHVRENIMHSHRDGTPEDIGAMVAFLLSDDAAWINGQCISVDGGWLFR
jgi:NAD(P)-dependent dehydrogenase (short-subunit alcohol dehydrogenase family)